MPLGVILLAAGASSRMGWPKLLLPWGETSILGHLIAQWQNLGAEQIVVVCAEGDAAMRAELDRLGFSAGLRIFNPQPARGMFSSVQCAALWNGWKPQLSHWTISLGDQPHVRTETLRALIDFAAAHPDDICQPGRQGRRRHPVVLPAPVFKQLRNAADETLKQFLERVSASRAVCELEDPGLDLDLDTPADYERAFQLCFNPSPPRPHRG